MRLFAGHYSYQHLLALSPVLPGHPREMSEDASDPRLDRQQRRSVRGLCRQLLTITVAHATEVDRERQGRFRAGGADDPLVSGPERWSLAGGLADAHEHDVIPRTPGGVDQCRPISAFRHQRIKGHT